MMSDEEVKSMDDAGKSQKVALEILTERFRQISDEGWTLEHDDEHNCNELADAAACYALGQPSQIIEQLWPWSIDWWKPTDKRRDLVKAGARIVAEIERLDRVEKGQEQDNG